MNESATKQEKKLDITPFPVGPVNRIKVDNIKQIIGSFYDPFLQLKTISDLQAALKTYENILQEQKQKLDRSEKALLIAQQIASKMIKEKDQLIKSLRTRIAAEIKWKTYYKTKSE